MKKEGDGLADEAASVAAMPAADTSVLGRMSRLLNAFSPARPAITIGEAAGLIAASEATAYRYLGELCRAGLLSRRTGFYVLGPKIIELEFVARSCDPILQTGEAIMRDLAKTTGCHVLLSNIYDDTIVNVFHAVGREPLNVTFTIGQPMPLFRGSQARVMLAFLDRRRARRIFDRHRDDPELRRLADGWDAFSTLLKETRKRGYYVSRGELDENVTGIAAPIFDRDRTVLGSLVLAFPSTPALPLSEDVLARIAMETADTITRRSIEVTPT